MKICRFATVLALGLVAAACSSDNEQAVKLQQEAAVLLAKANSDPAQMDQALALTDQALDLEPDYTPALATRYKIRVARREYGQALEDINHIHQIAPKDTSVILPRCMLMERLGQQGDAQQCYTQADHALRSLYRDEGAINTDVLAATILARDPEAEQLKERYLEQQRTMSPAQGADAARTIGRFEDGTYLRHYFP